MAVIISISEKAIPNPVLAKLKALDRKRDEKMIAEYKKALQSGQTRLLSNKNLNH